MGQHVKMPDGSIAQFPDGMPPEEMESAIHTHIVQDNLDRSPVPQVEEAPFSRRFMEAFGNPQDSPPPPSLLNRVTDALSMGAAPVARMAKGIGSNLVDRVKEGYGEVKDAASNIHAGGPVNANLGKATLGMEDAAMRSFPLITPGIQNFGEDIYDESPAAAAGSGLATILQGAMMADRPASIAPEYGSKLISGEKTLPTIHPDIGGAAGAAAGYAADPMHTFYGYLAGKLGSRVVNAALESPTLNKGVGYALGGRAAQGGIKTLSPLEAGETTVPGAPPSTPPAPVNVPTLQEETLPAAESPALRGAPGRPPNQVAPVPPLSLMDKIQSPLEDGESDIVPGNEEQAGAGQGEAERGTIEDMPNRLIHATPTRNLKDIVEGGLKAQVATDNFGRTLNQEPGVFAFTNPDEAQRLVKPTRPTAEEIEGYRSMVEHPEELSDEEARELLSAGNPEKYTLLNIDPKHSASIKPDWDWGEGDNVYSPHDIPPEDLSIAQENFSGRPEIDEDNEILQGLRSGTQTEGNRLLKRQFEDAGAAGGHEARKGLYESVTGLPASDFGEEPTAAPEGEGDLMSKLKASLQQVGGLADDIRPAPQGTHKSDVEVQALTKQLGIPDEEVPEHLSDEELDTLRTMIALRNAHRGGGNIQ